MMEWYLLSSPPDAQNGVSARTEPKMYLLIRFARGAEREGLLKTLGRPVAEDKDTLLYTISDIDFEAIAKKFPNCSFTLMYKPKGEWRARSWWPKLDHHPDDCPLATGAVVVTLDGFEVVTTISRLYKLAESAADVVLNGSVDPLLEQLVQLWRAGRMDEFRALALASLF